MTIRLPGKVDYALTQIPRCAVRSEGDGDPGGGRGDERLISNKQRENYGRGEHTIEADDFYSPEAVVANLRTAFASPQYQPPVLPAIALELMALTQQPEVSLQQVRDLLERDAVLTAQVLKVAQSALYGSRSFSSLTDAISLLGLQNVSDIFLQTALSAQVFRAKGFEAPMDALRRHSTVTAHVARLICRQTSLPDEYAFLCGLLHDVGMAAGILILAGRAPISSGKSSRRAKPPAFEELAPSLQSVHQEASEILAKAWKLPSDVQLVLRHHHHFMIGGRAHPLAAAVCLADWMASSAGANIGNEVDDLSALNAAKALRLDDATAKRLREQTEKLVESV